MSSVVYQRPYATGRLEDLGRQNDEKMPHQTVHFRSHKTGNAQSGAAFFRHSAVLSLPAVLLPKVSITGRYTSLFVKELIDIAYLTIRLRARVFYEQIVNEAQSIIKSIINNKRCEEEATITK